MPLRAAEVRSPECVRACAFDRCEFASLVTAASAVVAATYEYELLDAAFGVAAPDTGFELTRLDDFRAPPASRLAMAAMLLLSTERRDGDAVPPPACVGGGSAGGVTGTTAGSSGGEVEPLTVDDQLAPLVLPPTGGVTTAA
jgi:hypothetical protein